MAIGLSRVYYREMGGVAAFRGKGLWFHARSGQEFAWKSPMAQSLRYMPEGAFENSSPLSLGWNAFYRAFSLAFAFWVHVSIWVLGASRSIHLERGLASICPG